jgi:Rrf2 family transcriptional regulator, nitric oxide-sensitive transcriptional repressor
MQNMNAALPAREPTKSEPKKKTGKRASMLRINKKMEYGMMALLYLNAKPDRVASVREIAEAHGIPEQLLSKVMQSLKGNQLVTSVYGNHGGYRLSRDLALISLFDLSRSVVGPVQLAACLEPGKQACPAMAGCTIMTPMSYLNKMIVQLFQETSLATLLSQQELKNEIVKEEVQ